MQFSDIKKRVAVNVGYVDSSGAILTGRDVTETDIGNWVNDRYLDDVVAMLMTSYPEDFTEKDAYMNFYKATAGISTISTTTIVADSAIFNSKMAGLGDVGDRIYNSTVGTYTRIESYTNTTTITTQDDMSSTWDAADTIYVLGKEFALGGNATDLRDVLQVGVMYSSDAENYTTCKYVDQNDVHKKGGEAYSEMEPVWYKTTSAVSSVPTNTIGILPESTENVASGIKITYTALPAALSSDSDVPRLPLSCHSLLVAGATADALNKLRRSEEALIYEQRYQVLKDQLQREYPGTRSSGARYVKADGTRLISNMMRTR